MAYFHCLIGGGSSGGGYELTVTCDADFAGTTITATDGVTTLTQTCPSSSPYEVVFAIPNGGEWTISGIISGQTYSTSIDIPDSLELHSVPEGSTVLPTDDIQTWLACAGITDKSYTTLAEVLADSTTLLALMSNNNAVDYLVRSTSWAGDSTVKVPTMTSNTAPSGEVIFSSVYSSSYPAYYAFDGNNSTFWSSQSSGNQYVGYKFTHAVKVNTLFIYPNLSAGTTYEFELQGSNDGSVYTPIDTFEVDGLTPTYVSINNDDSYMYYKISRTGGWQAYAIQFYQTGITTDSTAMTDIGANNYCADTLLSDSTWAEAICNSEYFESVLNAKVPTMTSNTTPSGTVIASGENSATNARWKAFDGNSSTSWAYSGSYPMYIGYTFDSPICCRLMKFLSINGDNEPKQYKVQASNDGFVSDIHDLLEVSLTSHEVSGTKILNNSSSYTSSRVLISTAWVSNAGSIYYTLQFYGREDV